MEEGSFSETIVGSLVKLYDFVDSCLLRMEDDGGGAEDAEELTAPPRSKRKAVASAIQRVICLIRRKDKEHEALLARNKMLESKLKNVSHVIRALDKISRIPEVPVLVKQENPSISEEDTFVEEQANQLSIIAETTEPEIIEDESVPSDRTDMSDPDDRNNCDDFNGIQGDQDGSREDQAKDRVGRSMHLTNDYLENHPKKQSTSPPPDHPPPQANADGIETSTPKLTRDQKETKSTGRRFFPKPKISDRILRPSSKLVGRSSSVDTVEEKATNADGAEMNNIEMKEIGVSIAQCDVNRNETIRVHDDTEQVYSDLSSDDEAPTKQTGRDENKVRNRSTSRESNSETSNRSSQAKFKLKEAVLNVDELCSTEKFKQSQAKIQHELLKTKLNKHTTRKKADTKCGLDYEDASDDSGTTRKRVDSENGLGQIAEDNGEDNGVSDDNFTDAMSKISNSPEHELIDLTDSEDEVTHGRRHIRFEEELDKDLVSFEDLASDEGSTDSVEHDVRGRLTKTNDEKDIDKESNVSVEQDNGRGTNETDDGHGNLDDEDNENDVDDNGSHVDQDENNDEESTDAKNVDDNVSDEDVENIEDADDNAEQVKDEDLENIRRRPALWKPKKEIEGVMEATYLIDFDLTVASLLTNETDTTRQEDMQHIVDQVDKYINSRDETKEKEKTHAVETTERSNDQTVEVDLLTINNYDSSDETLVDVRVDQYNEDRTDKLDSIYDKHQNEDVTNCNNSNVRDSTHKMNKYGTNSYINENASPHEHPEQYDESTSACFSATDKSLVYNAANSVNIDSNTFLSYQEGCEINRIDKGTMSRGYGQISTNVTRIGGTDRPSMSRGFSQFNNYKGNEQSVQWYTREYTRDESCQERSGGERTLTGKQCKKKKENTRLEENGYNEDMSSYTSDDNYDRTETESKDFMKDQVEPGPREMRDKIRRAQKLPAEAMTDTDDSMMESSSREELRPRHNLRGRRRKLSVSESEEDEVIARKYPKRQTSKTKLATNYPEQSKAENPSDAEQNRARPKRFCAKPKQPTKVEEKDKEAGLSQVKPKGQARVRGQKRHAKGSEA